MRRKWAFTTFDVAEIMGVKRARLHEWIRLECVSASMPSPGRGRAARWTKEDLCKIELFRRLLTITDRETARRYCHVALSFVGDWKSKQTFPFSFKYFIVNFTPCDIDKAIEHQVKTWIHNGMQF